MELVDTQDKQMKTEWDTPYYDFLKYSSRYRTDSSKIKISRL